MAKADLIAELRGTGPHLSIGLLTADLLRLGDAIEMLERVGARIAHTDVMDGVFCPSMTVGPPFVKAQKTAALLKDCHLMITEPQAKVEDYVAAGADIITVHPEGNRYAHRALQVLGGATNANDPDRGIIRGIALNPGTPLEWIDPVFDEVDYILLVAINPGWGGQSFTPAIESRVRTVRERIDASGRPILLGVDGAVTKANVAAIAAMGPDIIVTGSAVFDGKVPEENARFMLGETSRTHVSVSRARDAFVSRART
jgi:ribulose-phosphate 3-epimerase